MVTEDDLMDALVAELNSKEFLQPRDVTIKRLALASGRAYSAIEKMMGEKVRMGELVVVKKLDPETSRVVNVYVKP
jgi:hypothetical protein